MEKKVVPPNRKKGVTPGGAGPKGRIEKDPDDLVHSPEHEMSSDQHEDPDDLVHRKGPLEMTVWKIRMILYMITRKMRMTGKIMFSANYPGATTNFVCGKRDNYFYHFSL